MYILGTTSIFTFRSVLFLYFLIYTSILFPTINSEGTEYSVYFDTTKPLGLKLSSDLFIQGFHRQGNSKLPGEASNWIRIGDKLMSINDQLTKGKDLNAVAQMVSTASLPKKLTFLTASGNRTEEMAQMYDGPSGIHGHEGIVELGKDGNSLGSLPYLQAMFGGPTNCRMAPLVRAIPPHGCGAYRNSEAIMDSIVLVQRGMCAFSDKAIMAQQMSALAIIIMNDNPGPIVRMPIDPSEKTDINLPVVMIDQSDASTILDLMNRTNNRKALEARLVRKGQQCKPWKKTNLIGEASANGQNADAMNNNNPSASFGDPSALSGELLLFMPELSLSSSIKSTVPTSSTKIPSTPSVRGGKTNQEVMENENIPTETTEMEQDNHIPTGNIPSYATAIPDGVPNPYDDSLDIPGWTNIVEDPIDPNYQEPTPTPEPESTDDNNDHHIHTAGYYSDSDNERNENGLLNNNNNILLDNQNLPLRTGERALTGGQRASILMKNQKEARKQAATGIDNDNNEELEAYDVNEHGEPLETIPTPSNNPSASPEPTENSITSLRKKAKSRFEYLLAKAGKAVPQGRLRVIVADPPDACSPLKNIKTGLQGVEGSALLVDRGGCTFSSKAANAAAANASLLLLSNINAGLFAVTTTDESGTAPDIPVVMVTKIAGRAIRAALNDVKENKRKNGKTELNDGELQHHHEGQSMEVHASETMVTVSAFGDSKYASIWEELTELMDTQSWPNEANARRKLYLRLSRLHHPDRSSGSADRFELLAYLYRRANFWYDPSSEPDFVDDYQAPMGGV